MLIRYPGSKDKHLKFLDYYFNKFDLSKGVVEPFSGTASVTFYLLKHNLVDNYVINDLDSGLAALWHHVKINPDKLIARVEAYKPNVEDFYKFKEETVDSDFEKGFRKLVLHQISFSGLGEMAGGPLGGRGQSGNYNVESRWRPAKLKTGIEACSALLNSAKGEITNDDWTVPVEKGIAEGKFIYLDPPYYERGKDLYVAGDINHKELAEELQKANNWLLSYNDLPEVRELYKKSKVETLNVRSQLHHNLITDLAIYRV